MNRWITTVVVVACGLVAGCSRSGEANRYRLSGTVQYDGQPIPFGDVLFIPDGSKGNSGPQGIAQIRDGKYDTSAAEGKGFAGGPTVVRVTGFSGPGGNLLCEVEIQVDLPRTSGTHDIAVPKQREAKPATGPEI